MERRELPFISAFGLEGDRHAVAGFLLFRGKAAGHHVLRVGGKAVHGVVGTLFAGLVIHQVQLGHRLTGLVPEGVGARHALGRLGGRQDTPHITQGVRGRRAGNGVHKFRLVLIGVGGYKRFQLRNGLALHKRFNRVEVRGNLRRGAAALHVQAVQVVVHALGTQHLSFREAFAQLVQAVRNADGRQVFPVFHELEFINFCCDDHVILQRHGNHGKAGRSMCREFHLAQDNISFRERGCHGHHQYKGNEDTNQFFHGIDLSFPGSCPCPYHTHRPSENQ